MNKLQTAKAIAIMQAYIDGKPLQWRVLGNAVWNDVIDPPWQWASMEYRIKPEAVKYRRMLLKTSDSIPIFYVDTVGNEGGVKRYEQDFRFVRWIDKEWIEEVV